MIRGLYSSGWSMIANGRKMDVIANNIANVNTNGFKKDSVVFESFSDVLVRSVNGQRSISNPQGILGTMQFSSDVGEIFTRQNQGQLNKTDKMTDLAISDNGNSFFTILAPEVSNGQEIQELYTRDGAFTINQQNYLTTGEGYLVMGQNGPIQLADNEFIVNEEGMIIQGENVVDTLLIRCFEDASTLRKIGTNTLAETEQSQEQQFNGKVLQGFLEQSNVNVISEMVDMITVLRAYEANQKILQIQDDALGKAVNEVGMIR